MSTGENNISRWDNCSTPLLSPTSLFYNKVDKLRQHQKSLSQDEQQQQHNERRRSLSPAPRLGSASPEISSSTAYLEDKSSSCSNCISSTSPPSASTTTADVVIQETCNCEELQHVSCHLETNDLWEKFNDLGTEMIITKTGR